MNRTILIQGGLIAIFVLAFILSTIFHELAHAIAASWLGLEPTLYHSYVSYDVNGVSAQAKLIVAAVGPLFSLVQASIFLPLSTRTVRQPLVSLFLLWLGLIGLVVFLGYMFMGPLADYGDTGKVYSILSVPTVIQYAIAAISLIALIVVLKRSTSRIADKLSRFIIAPEDIYRQNSIRYFVIPVTIGTLVNVLISLPVPTNMSLIFPLAVGVMLIPSGIRLIRSGINASQFGIDSIIRSEWVCWAFLAVTIGVVILTRWLATGVRL